MTRNEFARSVANKMKKEYPNARISNEDAKLWTIGVLECLEEEVLNQDRVTLIGFGTFEKKIANEHKRWDVNKKCNVVDPKRTKIKFTFSNVFNKKIAELNKT